MHKVSLFKNSGAQTPLGHYEMKDIVNKIKTGFWRKAVENVRAKRSSPNYKLLKEGLPAVSVSGEFKTRNKNQTLSERLTKHSGLICLDVDKKDNPKMRTKDLIDRECLYQYASCSGEGIKIVYRCKQVTTAEEHKRIYDAAVKRLEHLGVVLKVDPIVKSIASLQYVSYDPELFANEKTKLVIQPLPQIKVKKKEPSKDISSDLEQLNSYVEALGNTDITTTYEDWLLVVFGLSYSFGEHGREMMHKICANYKGYSKIECDEKYDACLLESHSNIEKPVTVATVFKMINDKLPKVTLRALTKKYNNGHATGVGEDTNEQGDLAGMVRYKLFLFKKVIDKETNSLVDLIPSKLNLNAFENLLRQKQFYRYDGFFVQLKDNIAETVDIADIFRVITEHVESEGDYKFTYNKTEFNFSWEEIAHLWREIRALNTTFNQVASSLDHWQPNLLKDNSTTSYIPYQNGVLKITKDKIELVEYAKLEYQIWRERILPRDFKYTDKKGMFEDFFANVCGRGKDYKQRVKSEHYKRAQWYFGYMLQGSKRQSTARAWLLYDIRAGNNGRSGKTIIGQAAGKIRSMVIIDGKQIDFKNRFAFQTVMPWTDIVFIDDPSKYMSLNPLFNMITGDLSAEKKNMSPIVKPVKFMIASNWVLEAEGSSESGRQFVTQLDDFYARYSKEHGDTLTPIVDLHGKEFFTDWDAKDWSEFDSFCARCLQYHLSGEAPKNTIMGNSNLVRFIQVNEEELFFELATVFVGNVKAVEGNCLAIPQQLLISVVKDHGVTANKAGKIAREFLKAIGAPSVTMTTVKVANMVRMAYKLHTEYSKLDFGYIAKNLPTPKL